MKKMHAAALEQNFWSDPHFPQVEIRWTKNSLQPYASHFHHTLSLGLITAGQTLLRCAGGEYYAQQGDLVLIEPNLVHSCNPLEQIPRSYYMLYLDVPWCLEQADTPQELSQGFMLSQRIITMPEAAAQVEHIIHALRKGQAEAVSLLGVLVGSVLQRYAVPRKSLSSLPLPLARTVQAFQAEPAVHADVAGLSRQAGLCREAFSRAFQRRLGLSPLRYLHCIRLEEGRRLLRKGVSIAEAAQATGYADQSHFHRMFVRYFSATPSQYRRGTSLLFKK